MFPRPTNVAPRVEEEPTWRPHASPALPELSVIIATDCVATIRKTLRYFQMQGDPARIEIVVAALAGARIPADAPELRCFPHRRIVPIDDAIDLARAELAAFHAATARYVVFAESCSYPRPGFVDSIVEAGRSEQWAVVGPAMVSANSESATSWAAMWINYGLFAYSDERGPVDLLPGHDSAYQRRALLSLGEDLDDLVRSLTAVQVELRARGYRLYLEPSACVEILNVSKPGWYLVDQFGKGRQFATLRRWRWSVAQRLLYAAGSPLIPVVRFSRILAFLRKRGRIHELWRGRRLALLAGGLITGAAGELVGYLFTRRTVPEFFERNLHRPRYLRADDARREADESRWPS